MHPELIIHPFQTGPWVPLTLHRVLISLEDTLRFTEKAGLVRGVGTFRRGATMVILGPISRLIGSL